MAKPFDVEGHHILIGASVGIAVAPLDGKDGDILMKNADLALYRAKDDGRGTYHFYEKGLDAALQERRSMETALRSALPGERVSPGLPAAAQPRGQPRSVPSRRCCAGSIPSSAIMHPGAVHTDRRGDPA